MTEMELDRRHVGNNVQTGNSIIVLLSKLEDGFLGIIETVDDH